MRMMLVIMSADERLASRLSLWLFGSGFSNFPLDIPVFLIKFKQLPIFPHLLHMKQSVCFANEAK
jgi:hypothetical protein